MNCGKHGNREAVGQCQKCGAGVCRECAEATSLLKDDCGTLCVDCYCNELEETKAYWVKARKKRRTRLIVSIILYILGAIAIIGGIVESEFAMIIVGVILCGIFTGITWRNAAKDAHEQKEREEGVTYVITENGVQRKDGFWMKVLFFFIGVIFGVIVTPIRVITDSVGLSKDKKAIKSLEQVIQEARAFV